MHDTVRYRPTMADRPRNDDWWLASDGRWYPPELRSDADGNEPSASDTHDGSRVISAALTNATSIAVALSSSLFVVAAFFGFRVAADIRESGEVLSAVGEPATANEVAFGAWLSFGLLAFVIAGVLVIAWTYTTSKALDARGATERRWTGGWAIGSWLIPIANFVLPKLVFNEIEKAAQVPHRGEDIADSWRSETRTQLADLWWGLWVTGVVASQVAAILASSEDAPASALADGLTINSVGLLVMAGAGVAFVLVIRRIAVFSRR